MNDCNNSKVSEFYEGRYIFITGATGFIGKVLLEKLLRSCSSVSSIYLLIRPKEGNDVKSRLKELLDTSVFEWIKRNNSHLLNKLIPVSGDITKPDLGLSKSDQTMLIDNVSIVFHSAATIRFNEELKDAVEMNLLGTKRLIQLCRTLKKLEALVHVSTAYCNCNEETVLEKVYPPPAKPDMIIQCVESLDKNILNSITPQIIANQPNTYTFTKALAEQILLESSDELPVAIVRPTIVTAAYNEPMRGWIDNLNGPTGLLIGAAKGVLRTVHACRELIADFVPVDIVINFMIVVAWHTSTSKPNKLMVYNCSSGVSNPISWGDFEKMAKTVILRNPCTGVIWYPGGSFKNNSFINWISSAAFHTIPAYLLDTITRLSGKKPILVRVQKKLKQAVSCLEFFTTHEWKFVNDNMFIVYGKLNTIDKEIFNFNINEVNWTKYMEWYWLGIRKYVLKEDPNNIEDAHRHLRKFYWMHRLSQLFMIVIFWKFLLAKSQTLQNTLYSTLSFILQFTKLLTTLLLQTT